MSKVVKYHGREYEIVGYLRGNYEEGQVIGPVNHKLYIIVFYDALTRRATLANAKKVDILKHQIIETMRLINEDSSDTRAQRRRIKR
jgi:hypothetical protein